MAVSDVGRKSHKKSESESIEAAMSDIDENFSDPEDYVDNITDEGKYNITPIVQYLLNQ